MKNTQKQNENMDSDDDSCDNNMDSVNDSTGDNEDLTMEVDETLSERNTEPEEYQYEVLTTDEIFQLMNDLISEVVNVINIPATATRILLHHFRWDKDKLMERYFEDHEGKLFSEAHVINPNNKPNLIHKPKLSTEADDCEICLSKFPSGCMTGLECGHKFCAQCYTEYITTKIMEEGHGQSITCAAYGCDILVDDVTVMKLLTDPKVKLKYQQLITNSFVQFNRLLRWCPSADCTYAIKVTYVNPLPVRCKCDHYFCFACGENWHDPVNCRLLKVWLKKCASDSETLKWIAANTKECPNCKVRIEKYGGCDHMICKNQNCNYSFCWVSLDSCEPYGSTEYNCSPYDEDAQEKFRKFRESFARYLHYYNRYMHHMQSLKFENKFYAPVKRKMEELQKVQMPWVEIQFLKKAVDILCQCRQTLMYTYVFAFYLRKNNQSIIFEDNLKDLETATQKLSEELKSYIKSENLDDIKQKLENKYRYCEKRRKALIDHVHEGYEQDWWLYTE